MCRPVAQLHAENHDGRLVWVGAPETVRWVAIVLHDMPDKPAAGRTEPARGPDETAATPADPPTDVRLWAAALVSRGAAVLAPWTGASWWTDGGVFAPPLATEACVEPLVTTKLLTLAAERYGAEPPRIALAGSGMGGHGALRLAYRFPQKFAAVAAWRPSIDSYRLLETAPPNHPAVARLRQLYGDPERARQDSATLHIHPLNWPRHQRFDCPPTDNHHEGADRLAMKLMSLGVPHESDLETAGDDSARDQGAGDEATRIDTLAGWLAERVG